MSTLRLALVLYVLSFLTLGVFLLMHARAGWDVALGAYFLINIAILGVGILFERGRYHPRNLPTEGWQPTGERFVDHTTGKMIEVDYHPETGQRRYREVE